MTGVSCKSLGRLLEGYPILSRQGQDEIEISTVVCDSRKVVPGSMFVAMSGIQCDGARYALDAVKRGAAAIVSESIIELEKLPEEKGFALIRVEDARNALAFIAARFYQHPSRNLGLIGVTGTNGKTTVTYLLESILNSKGFSSGVIGTVGYRYGGQTFPAEMTTPESIDINRMLSEMNDMEVDYCM